MEIVDPADKGDLLATYYADATKVSDLLLLRSHHCDLCQGFPCIKKGCRRSTTARCCRPCHWHIPRHAYIAKRAGCMRRMMRVSSSQSCVCKSMQRPSCQLCACRLCMCIAARREQTVSPSTAQSWGLQLSSSKRGSQWSNCGACCDATAVLQEQELGLTEPRNYGAGLAAGPPPMHLSSMTPAAVPAAISAISSG